MSTLLQDLRYALRGLRRSTGFAAVAIVTLALGVGANTAIFSVLNAMVLRPMPGVAEPARLVWITHVENGRAGRVSYPDFADYRERAGVFTSAAAVDHVPVHLATADATERIQGQIAGGDYFSTLGLVPAAGRFFGADDDRARRPVAVISAGYWRRRFGGSASTIGRSVSVNGRPFTIVGVAPDGFGGLDMEDPPDVYLPLETFLSGTERAQSLTSRRSEHYQAIARLKPGLSKDAAATAVAAIAASNAPLRDADRRRLTASLETPRGWVPPGHMHEVLPIAGVGLAATGLVLLIAAANVANLLLGRAARRRREIGIRLAIGASRGRIVRQLLTESVIFSALGAGAGVVLSSWVLEVLLARFEAPPLLQPVVDGRVLAWALVSAVATAILFGLAPAFAAARPDVVPALQDAAAGGASRSGHRLQALLVAVQVSLSLVLLAAGGLLTRSLAKAAEVPIGFDRGAAPEIVTLSFDPVTQGYPPERAQRLRERMLERAREIPGVRAAALSELLPLSNRAMGDTFVPGDEAGVPATDVYFDTVSPGYFATLGLPLVAGRDFGAVDRDGSTPVAIVNETLARRFWPGKSPIGRRLSVANKPSESYEVIGVARDGKYLKLTEPALPYAYFPIAQGAHLEETTLIVRGEAADSVAHAIRRAARELDPALPLFKVETLADSLRRNSSFRREGTLFVAGFGVLALVLAGVGLYGVVAFAVGERRREIGIRMALGARRADVLSLFVRRGARLAGFGIAAGLVVSLGVTRLLSSMLFGVTPLDLAALAGASALLAGIAVLASAVPARRAARIDPAAALRAE
jgi:putative ABC transport system permease protein